MKALERVEGALDQKQFELRHELEIALIEEELVTLRADYDRLTWLYTREQIAVQVANQRSDIFTKPRVTEPDGTRIIVVSDTTNVEELPRDTRNEIDAKILALSARKKDMTALLSQDDQTKQTWLKSSVDNCFKRLLLAYAVDKNLPRERHEPIVVNTNEQALLALVIYPDLCPSFEPEIREIILAKFITDQRKILRADNYEAALTMIQRARRLGLIPLEISAINDQERRLLYFLTTLPTNS